MEFVVRDWLTDPKLSLCKESTRGIWMDALCHMFLHERCGQLTGSMNDLARLCRTTPNAMRMAVNDLKLRDAAEVSECSHDTVTITNRRMRTEYEIRVSARERKRKERHGVDSSIVGDASVTLSVTGESPPNTNSHPYPNPQPPLNPPEGEGSGFDLFWKSWPRHFRKSDKKLARTRWATQGCETVAEAIMASLEEWKQSEQWLKDAGNWIPAPDVWLNKRRWEAGTPPPPKIGDGLTDSDRANVTRALAGLRGK